MFTPAIHRYSSFSLNLFKPSFYTAGTGIPTKDDNDDLYSYIYFACLFVSLSVRLYPINVKRAEPIGTKFCVDIT